MLTYTHPHQQGAAASEASDGGSRRLSVAQMAQGHRPERRRPCHQPFFTQAHPGPRLGPCSHVPSGRQLSRAVSLTHSYPRPQRASLVWTVL